jgi:homoserine kinase
MLYLYVDAYPQERVTVEATGRNAEICGALENNLLLESYRNLLASQNREFVPLRLEVRNEIPLGMGLGSSAAVRLAAVALASHFGGLGWSHDQILTQASRLEGHPDNAAASLLGGFVASAFEGDEVRAISIRPPRDWHAVIVMPDQPLATGASRGMLPATYARKDVVANLQRVALLTAAFATGRADFVVSSRGVSPDAPAAAISGKRRDLRSRIERRRACSALANYFGRSGFGRAKYSSSRA